MSECTYFHSHPVSLKRGAPIQDKCHRSLVKIPLTKERLRLQSAS